MSHKRLWIIAIVAAFIIPGIVTFFYSFKQLPNTANIKPQNETSLIKARELFYQGKYKEAEEAFKILLGQNPRNIKVLSAMGTLYYRQGNTELAMKYWNEALKISPDDTVLRGLVNSVKQKNSGGKPIYHMGGHMGTEAETSDNGWETHYNKGQELYYKEDYKGAVSEFKKARDLRPDDSGIYFVLGASYLRLDDRKNTIKMWEQALNLSPDDQLIMELLAKVKNKEQPLKSESVSQ